MLFCPNCGEKDEKIFKQIDTKTYYCDKCALGYERKDGKPVVSDQPKSVFSLIDSKMKELDERIRNVEGRTDVKGTLFDWEN